MPEGRKIWTKDANRNVFGLEVEKGTFGWVPFEKFVHKIRYEDGRMRRDAFWPWLSPGMALGALCENTWGPKAISENAKERVMYLLLLELVYLSEDGIDISWFFQERAPHVYTKLTDSEWDDIDLDFDQ